MLDLGKIRDEIDVTDDEIVRLFQHRMALTAEVAQYKIETGKAVFDAERERQKLEKLTGEGTNAFNTKGIQELFQQIMSISRKRQYQLLTENGGEEMTDYTQVDHLPTHGRRVVFQGVEGAYSFGAMKEFFDDTITSFHVDTWKEAMEAITKDIRTVISHPQALAQCRRFLDSNENWKTEERLNTAAAAKEVSESGDLTMAAVGSPYAAEHFGLQILKEGIFDARGNTTRFVIISGQKRFVKDAQKISVCMELPHQSGSLYNALAHFIYSGNGNTVFSWILKGI